MTSQVPSLPTSPGRQLLMPLVCLVLVAAALWWANRLTVDVHSWPGERWTEAQAWVSQTVDDERPPSAANWQPVTLPDNWKVSRPTGAPSVWYRIAFDRPAGDTPSVLIPRLATSGQVFLNGSRLWDSRTTESGVTRSWNAPLLLILPAGLLKDTGNELHVQVSGQARYRAGLSQIQVGPHAALYPRHEWRRFWQHDGAMLSCAISVVAGVLMMLSWLRMRSESMYLFFGLATVFWAARNSNLFLDQLPISINTWAVLLHTGHTWFNVLFGVFVLRFTQTHWPRFEKLLWLYGILSSGMMLLGNLVDIEHVMRLTGWPGALLYFLLVGLLLRKGWRDRSVESSLIAAATLTFMTLSIRDGLLLSSKLPYDAYYISHYSGVLMLGAIAWGLVARLERALRSVEQLAVTLETRVQERTRSLQEANAAKTRFLAAASHDLRQPVVAIGLLAGLLREQLSGPLATLAQRLVLAVGALESMLKGLLDVSRLDTGSFKAEQQAVPLQEVFDSIAAHEAEAAQAKGIRLRCRPTVLVAKSDRVLLEQILRNLVGNAVRYTDRGGVLVAARRRGDQVLLQVWDSGRGIPEARQAEVFEEFVQLGNPQRDRSQGLGLGLALVRRGAALLGVPLSLRSTVGRGSCFSVTVPGAAASAAPALAEAGTASSLKGLSVVLVEDDPAVCQALAQRLRAWGAVVMAFERPTELFRMLGGEAGTPLTSADLLITDQRLPEATGVEVAARVRSHLGTHLPVLVITADTAPQDIAPLAASGLPVLCKPFGAQDLLRAIEALRKPGGASGELPSQSVPAAAQAA
jgi:signal transduction histidine kinase/CheY-like chemotaxis protein